MQRVVANLSRRDFLTLLAAVPVWLSLPSGLVSATTLRVLGLRRWSAPEATRLVFETDAPVTSFPLRHLQDPERIVLEILSAQHSLSGAAPIQVEDGIVRNVRFENTPTSVLVHIELQRAAQANVFYLAPNAGGEHHRIVLDVGKTLTAAEQHAKERDVEAVRRSGDVVVAIDAGHGGNDPGTSGNGVIEKDVALDVAVGLAKVIDARSGMRAVLTRDRDYFVPLGHRQAIAQRYGSHVFVSIHLNSAPSRSARGSEVFFLSPRGAAEKAARELIDRENAADQIGGVPPGKGDDVIVNILWDMKQNENMRQSERLADSVLGRLQTLAGSESRGLKQGPLAVLKSIRCPSVLVELGFVTNRQDARMMTDAATQRRYAELVADGVEAYVRANG